MNKAYYLSLKDILIKDRKVMKNKSCVNTIYFIYVEIMYIFGSRKFSASLFLVCGSFKIGGWAELRMAL